MFAQACFFLTLLLSESVFAEVTNEDTEYTVSNGTSLKDGADEFVLTDSNGNFSGVVDMFVDKGYQIDKPTEEKVCLIRNIKETVTEDVCYVRKSISHDDLISMNMTGILEHCQDREVFFEEPKKCNELTLNSKELGRERRQANWITNVCCHYRSRVTVSCVRTESYCCRRFFGLCFETCTRCCQTTTICITEYHCHVD